MVHWIALHCRNNTVDRSLRPLSHHQPTKINHQSFLRSALSKQKHEAYWQDCIAH